jgi:hypothetical protein
MRIFDEFAQSRRTEADCMLFFRELARELANNLTYYDNLGVAASRIPADFFARLDKWQLLAYINCFTGRMLFLGIHKIPERMALLNQANKTLGLPGLAIHDVVKVYDMNKALELPPLFF